MSSPTGEVQRLEDVVRMCILMNSALLVPKERTKNFIIDVMITGAARVKITVTVS